MNQRRTFTSERPRPILVWLPILCLLLIFGASTADAVSYYVYGQIYQITPEDADDLEIEDADLIGLPHPYGLVRVYDTDSGSLLGESVANEQGIFTVNYDLPAGSTPNVRCRVFVPMTDPATDLELPAARGGINSFAGVGRFFGSPLWIVPPEFLAYSDLTGMGGLGLNPWPGVGIVFTRVGKVELPFIEQDSTQDHFALADYSTDPENRHGELHLRGFRDAPFSHGLLIFGDFGEPGTPCLPNDEIDYYQVYIQGPGDPDPVLWTQTMNKMRTTVITAGPVSVTSELKKIGPFTDSVDPTIEGLYWVNENAGGPGFQTIWSFPDLRVNWRSHDWQGGPANGLYEITMKYYKQTGTDWEAPIVQELDSTPLTGCFASTPPTGSSLGLNRLLLMVNNQPMDFSLDHIFLRSGPGAYFKKGSATDVPRAQAYDYASEGLCDIMQLTGTYDVEVEYTATHPAGYMRYYRLNARSNAGTEVAFANESYDPTSPSAPVWDGALPGTISIEAHEEFEQCNYIFRLRASSRLQNGYHHVQWRHRALAYYVVP